MAGFVSATNPLIFLLFPFRRQILPCFRGLSRHAGYRDASSRRLSLFFRPQSPLPTRLAPFASSATTGKYQGNPKSSGLPRGFLPRIDTQFPWVTDRFPALLEQGIYIDVSGKKIQPIDADCCREDRPPGTACRTRCHLLRPDPGPLGTHGQGRSGTDRLWLASGRSGDRRG